jgi:transposase-like protein
MFERREHFNRFPCPKCKKSQRHLRDGHYFRKSDGRLIQRLRCRFCNQRYSTARFDPAYRQNKRKINFKLARLLASNISLRRSARILQVSRTTIDRKFRFLGEQCRIQNERYLKSLRDIQHIEFDDLHTIEHTKLKPLSVTIAVDRLHRKILGFEVSTMPASGHLAAFARKKYGKREDGRPQAIDRVLRGILPMTTPSLSLTSDEHPYYAPIVRRYYPQATYTQVIGARGAVTGQGELKKLEFDPLFILNHTCAMLRANVNRLIRKTWCTTKKPERLTDHLNIYVLFHNKVLTNHI